MSGLTFTRCVKQPSPFSRTRVSTGGVFDGAIGIDEPFKIAPFCGIQISRTLILDLRGNDGAAFAGEVLS